MSEQKLEAAWCAQCGADMKPDDPGVLGHQDPRCEYFNHPLCAECLDDHDCDPERRAGGT